MKKVKYTIIILTMLIVILIVTICVIPKRNNNIPELSVMQDVIDVNQTEKISDIEDYLKVRNCANAYLKGINIENSSFYGYDESGNYINLMSEQEMNNYIYNVLSEEYISKETIEINNVKNYVYKIKESCFFVPIKLIEKGNNEKVKTFGTYGVIVTQDYQPLIESYMIINIDENNSTFSIEQLKNQEELNNIKVNIPAEITKKDNNVFQKVGIAHEDLIKGYLNDYKRLALAYPEVLYNNFLDDDYKNKRFENLQSFKDYVNENRNNIVKINLEKYQVSEQEGYTQYITIDKNGVYYIFKSKSPWDYKIILDTYTVDLPQFTDKYNIASVQQKVAYNIDRFIQAINDESYYYAYNCLADSYKNNYFKTQQEFENYVKENFYESTTVEYKEFNTEGELYTYSVILKNNVTGEQMKKTFIMKLGEGTGFVLSFNR